MFRRRLEWVCVASKKKHVRIEFVCETFLSMEIFHSTVEGEKRKENCTEWKTKTDFEQIPF